MRQFYDISFTYDRKMSHKKTLLKPALIARFKTNFLKKTIFLLLKAEILA
ncbi:hypothetical protein JOD96_000744 [Flavobacterium sp. 1355]|nr:hypothetical protein [Flavobacterium sp. 1355]